MTEIHFDTRRIRAASALVLAFSLQICGCNPVPDCQRMLQLQLSSLASQRIKQRCAQCLTPREMTSLLREQGDLLLAGAVATIRSEATIQQTLLNQEGPSFYDPNSDLGSGSGFLAGSAPAGGIASSTQASPLRRPNSSDLRFTPSPIPESVFFVYKTIDASGGQRRVPIATAFVLSVPDVHRRTLARFLVTARHVVDPEWAHCSNQNPSSVEVRLNRRGGGFGYERISLEDKNIRHYFIPADGISDIAIMRLDEQLIPGLDSYNFVDTPFQLLPTKADLRTIAATQQVVTASLRTQGESDVNAFPVSGRGVLASTSEEPVNIHCGSTASARSLHVLLIEVAAQQGVSGSPVYTSLVRDGDATPTTVLLGVQAIAWPNQGVAGITPSTILADLIQSALVSRNEPAGLYRGAIP